MSVPSDDGEEIIGEDVSDLASQSRAGATSAVGRVLTGLLFSRKKSTPYLNLDDLDRGRAGGATTSNRTYDAS